MLEGTVTKFEHDLDLVRGYAVMTVRGTDGRIYMVSYMYELYPVEFQVGEKFRFYGLLSRGYDYQPELVISYYEKIDE